MNRCLLIKCNIVTMPTCIFNLLSIKAYSVIYLSYWFLCTYVHRTTPSIGCHIHRHIVLSTCYMVHRLCNVLYSSRIVDLKCTVYLHTLKEIIKSTYYIYMYLIDETLTESMLVKIKISTAY